MIVVLDGAGVIGSVSSASSVEAVGSDCSGWLVIALELFDITPPVAKLVPANEYCDAGMLFSLCEELEEADEADTESELCS